MDRQIQSLTQQRGRCTQRATESLRKFNMNRTWETGLQRRVAPTPRTQHTVLPSAQPPWNQANGNTLCPSELYITAKSEARFPGKKKNYLIIKMSYGSGSLVLHVQKENETDNSERTGKDRDGGWFSPCPVLAGCVERIQFQVFAKTLGFGIT